MVLGDFQGVPFAYAYGALFCSLNHILSLTLVRSNTKLSIRLWFLDDLLTWQRFD